MTQTDSERHPRTVYDPLLGRGITPAVDPLPPAVTESVFHYTGAEGALGVISSGKVFVSHAATMNDPIEGSYGWQVIRDRFVKEQPKGAERFSSEFEQLLADDEARRGWEPAPFVLSGTLLSDNLNQYRLYGMYQLELESGTWRAEPSGPFAERARGHYAQWRRVLYGATAAQEYVDRMLAWAVTIMDSVPQDEFEDTGLVAALAVQVLALHIKPEAYSHEEEVRLVFSVPHYDWDDHVHVRSARGRLLPHVSASTGKILDGFVKSVTLGPTVQGQANAEAIAHLHRLYYQSSRYSPFKTGFPVRESRIRYRG